MYKAGIALLIFSNLTIWFAVIIAPNSHLNIVYCDVGQGDAALIIKGDMQLLIDGGPDNSVLECLSKHVPFYDRQIEMLVMTHPQADHAAGLLDVIKSYRLLAFVAGPEANQTQGYYDIVTELNIKKVPLMNLYAGDRLGNGDIEIKVLWPSREFVLNHTDTNAILASNVLGLATDGTDLNSFGIVLEISYREFDALFTADTDLLVEDEQLSLGLLRDVDVLKVPHHGSKTGMSSKWLDVVTPELAVISVGRKNSYGHPAEETLKRLNDKAIKTLRTDIDGEVVVESDGTDYWLK